MVVVQAKETGASPSPTLSLTYEQVWRNTAYRRFAPGERHVDEAIQALKPRMGASFIDFGCGTGRPAQAFRIRGYNIVGVDFAENCLDENVDIPLLVADLTKPLPLTAEWGFCTDVMEHVAPETVDDVLVNICTSCRKGVFFAIALVPDHFGPAIAGKPLHLTVQSAEWWQARLEACWPRVEILTVAKETMVAACFVWPPRYRRNVRIEALCNTSDDIIDQYIETNAKRGLPFISIGEELAQSAILVGGGPSLAGSLDTIKELARDGGVIFALNNVANYLLDNDIVADYQLLIDSRPENVKFLKGAAKSHILSAQCHPSLFDHLAGNPVLIFYPAIDGIREKLPRETDAAPLIGGMITSGLQAMSVAYTMGFRKLHLLGYDSSDAPSGDAHAYAQEQTTAERKRLDVEFEGKKYRSSFAMFKQAEDFGRFSQMLADHGAEISVHGEGLLPDIARDMVRELQALDQQISDDSYPALRSAWVEHEPMLSAKT
jgi:SAM-dependent methyltransferase